MHIHVDGIENVEQCQTVLDGKAVDHIHEQNELAHFLHVTKENEYHICQKAVQSLATDCVLDFTPSHRLPTFGDMMMRLLKMIFIFYV